MNFVIGLTGALLALILLVIVLILYMRCVMQEESCLELSVNDEP